MAPRRNQQEGLVAIMDPETIENHDASLTRCCIPSGDCLRADAPISLDDLRDAVKVACNNDHCSTGRYMHRECFDTWEQTVLTYLKSCGRARSWSERQRHQNLWTKKGYDLAFKACGCRCGKGHLKKDLDWMPPPPGFGLKEDDASKKKKRRNKQNNRPSLAVSAHHNSELRARTGSLSSSNGSSSPPASASSVSPVHSGSAPGSGKKKSKFEFFSDRHNSGNGIFARRQDFSSFNSLPRHKLNSYHIKEFPQNLGRFRKTFSEEQVKELKQYVTDIDRRAFGMTRKQLSNLCFDYAEKNGVSHRFNVEKETAGEGFIREFMKECRLTLRKPESTSVARLMAFNRVNVGKFYELLREVRLKYSFTAHQIYNVDETGFSTVPTKNPKVISPVGTRRVIKVSSAERGVTVTCVCAMSATGNFIPPFLVYPRVRMNPKFLDGAPPGSTAVPHISGWITGPNFVNYLKHFASHARPNMQHPILLLMDNHASHITLEAIQFCRENGIVMLGFPPHTSHRLQPLDVGFYGPFKTAYSQACDDFMVSNPGSCITLTQIPKIIGNAYLKVTALQIAVNAFKATGIEPFDSNIFRDEDFQPSLTTDIQPVESNQLTAPAFEPEPELSPENFDPAKPPTANDFSSDQHRQSQPIITKPFSQYTNPTPSTSALPPLPMASKVTLRKPRQKLPSFLLSGTPVKEVLEQKKKEQEEKELKRQKRLSEKANKKKGHKKEKRQKKLRRQLNFLSSSDDESSLTVPFIDTDDDMDLEDSDKFCIICAEEGKDELWYQCFKCLKWAHADCSGWDQREASQRPYKCDLCI